MIYVTSDLHLNHNKSFIYKARGYNTIEEMNEDIIAKWNNIITEDDKVYICGDLLMGNISEGIPLLRRLNGNFYIIGGNHDTEQRLREYAMLPNTVFVSFGEKIKYGKWNFYLTHFPMIMGNHDTNIIYDKRAINLSGHTHSKDRFENNQYSVYNVAMDAHNNTPVSIEDIIKDIKENYR